MRAIHVPTALAIAAAAALAACGSGEEDVSEAASEGREMSADEVAEEIEDMRLRPGQWEVTSEVVSVEAEGMPEAALSQMRNTKTTATDCITEAEANQPEAGFLAAQEDMNCSYRDFSMRGGRIKGAMTCSPEGMGGEMAMVMDGTFERDSYAMDMDTEMSNMGGMNMDMTMKMRVSGKRLGACRAG